MRGMLHVTHTHNNNPQKRPPSLDSKPLHQIGSALLSLPRTLMGTCSLVPCFPTAPRPVPIRLVVVTRRDSRGGPAPFSSRNRQCSSIHGKLTRSSRAVTRKKGAPTKLSGWVSSFNRWGKDGQRTMEAARMPRGSAVAFPSRRQPRSVRPTTRKPNG